MADFFDIRCPSCGKPFAAATDRPRRCVDCPTCGERFVVNPPGGPPPGGYDRHQFPTVSGAAVASVVCGVLCFAWPVTPAAAIICGVIGMDASRMPNVRGRGMSIWGLILGCIALVLGFPAVWFGPGLYRAHELANQAKCVANMTAIWKEISDYRAGNDRHFPPSLTMLAERSSMPTDLFVCPDSDDCPAKSPEQVESAGHCSYRYFARGEVDAGPADLVLAEEDDNHDSGVNLLFGDGHVQWMPLAAAKPIVDKARAEMAGRHNG
jgi:prepilin-type processing-associated H-X9-DG protein